MHKPSEHDQGLEIVIGVALDECNNSANKEPNLW